MELLCCENVIFKQEMCDLILRPPCLNRLAEMHLVHQFQTGLPLPEWGRCWTFKSTFRQNTFSLHEKKKIQSFLNSQRQRNQRPGWTGFALTWNVFPLAAWLAGRNICLEWACPSVAKQETRWYSDLRAGPFQWLIPACILLLSIHLPQPLMSFKRTPYTEPG